MYVIGITKQKTGKSGFAVTPNVIIRKPAGARLVEKALVKAVAKIGKKDKFNGVDGKTFRKKLEEAAKDGNRGRFLSSRFRFDS